MEAIKYVEVTFKSKNKKIKKNWDFFKQNPSKYPTGIIPILVSYFVFLVFEYPMKWPFGNVLVSSIFETKFPIRVNSKSFDNVVTYNGEEIETLEGKEAIIRYVESLEKKRMLTTQRKNEIVAYMKEVK